MQILHKIKITEALAIIALFFTSCLLPTATPCISSKGISKSAQKGSIQNDGDNIDCEEAGALQLPPMGREMRSEFLLDENFIQLNHGSYGTHPKAVRTALWEFQDRAEANPDLWMRREAEIELAKVRKRLAQFINADEEDVVMVINTTSGMNAIFRSLLFNFGERILYFSTVYGSMGSLIKYICDTSTKNVTSLVFEVNYPISNQEIVSNLSKFLEENHDPQRPIRIALIDHITSVPGAIVPIEEIIPLLKSYGITVLIDGAHAIGQVPIDIKKLQPDYYITNCHKWLYGPRGSAIMFVDKRHQGTIHPAHVNSGYKIPSDFQGEFFWTGTMDYSPYMAVPAAIRFRESIPGGEDAVMNYTHNLAIRGGQYLAARYGTRVLQDPDQIGAIVDVQLPIVDHSDPTIDANWLQTELLLKYNLYAAPYKHNGIWWARHSAQIYNDDTDFEAVGNAFEELCEQINMKRAAKGDCENGTLVASEIVKDNNCTRER